MFEIDLKTDDLLTIFNQNISMIHRLIVLVQSFPDAQ